MNSSTAGTQVEATLLNLSVERHRETAWSMIPSRNLFFRIWNAFGGLMLPLPIQVNWHISAHNIVEVSLSLNSFFLTFNKKFTIRLYHDLAALGLSRTLCFYCDTWVRFRKFHAPSYLSAMRQGLVGRFPMEGVPPLVTTWVTEGFMQLN